jgi:multidrug efflux pump
VFDTMQIYLGSLYVNDFNRFGRTYSVRVQADAQYRARAEDVGLLKVRAGSGEMVPLSALMNVRPSAGPERAMRYNGFLSADVNGRAAPGYSSGQAQDAIQRIAAETLPPGIGYEWTELTYQDRLTRGFTVPGTKTQVPVLAAVMMIAVLLVVLVLTAQYESFSLPMAIVMIVPMCVLAALFGVWLSHFPPFAQPGDLNIFTQVALVVLVGLACKNAILIVEFAKELEERGEKVLDAVMHACRMRLRPILMTSIATVAGAVPLMLASGAGAAARTAIGVVVVWGVAIATLITLFLIPILYARLARYTDSPEAVSRKLEAQLARPMPAE